jgi:LAO/AO transport system kinase
MAITKKNESFVMDLAQKIIQGDMGSIARGISLVENDSEKTPELMKEIFPYTGQSVIVGMTGAPGSGKSTLVDQLIGSLKKQGKKIGIIAVDPSSPFSGGAILGDRIRMMRHSIDPDIFIRSMATRGHLGGLAKATGDAIAVLEASGKDFILVETVGVGQDEVEIVKLADIILVLLTPGTGDDIQAFKAGIMEIADIFVLNKADSPLTERAESQLRAVIDLGLKENRPPVVKTVATDGQGMEELIAVLNGAIEKRDVNIREVRKKKLLTWMLRGILNEKIYNWLSQEMTASDFEYYVQKIYERELDPYTAADQIINIVKGCRDDSKN